MAPVLCCVPVLVLCVSIMLLLPAPGRGYKRVSVFRLIWALLDRATSRWVGFFLPGTVYHHWQ